MYDVYNHFCVYVVSGLCPSSGVVEAAFFQKLELFHTEVKFWRSH